VNTVGNMIDTKKLTMYYYLQLQYFALMRAVETAGFHFCPDVDDGCPPCNAISNEESCIGCPYRMRDIGEEKVSGWKKNGN
jgi:hypothetical protein